MDRAGLAQTAPRRRCCSAAALLLRRGRGFAPDGRGVAVINSVISAVTEVSVISVIGRDQRVDPS
jgi:hypothetical protein